MAWTRLCTRDELPPIGQARLCEIAGKGGAVVRIALVRTAAGLHALDDHCPHRAGPMSQGWIEAPACDARLGLASAPCLEDENRISPGTITCPWHQWTFDLATGACTNIPGQKIKIFKVVEKEGVIGIDL